MTLTFIQFAAFVADWKDLGLGDGDLRAMEALLLDRPERGQVIPGTGGLRKLRFAPPSWHTGKRGAARVVYAHFPDVHRLYLFAIYGKAAQADLSPADRKRFATLLTALGDRLRKGTDR